MNDGALRLADRRAREAAQTVFDRPLAVIAGAGTGKTSALVARIVAWCTGPGWERAREHVPDGAGIAPRVLQRVVAITFTEAAAAEMAERLSRAFSKLSRGELPEGVLEHALPEPELLGPRARALLESLDQLGVRTIHAWCRMLLAAQPLDAGLHPAFEIDADDSARTEVAREVVESALRGEWADGRDPVFAELARTGVGPDVIEAELLRALDAGVPPEALESDPLAPERVAAFLAALTDAIAAFEAADAGRLAAAPGAKRGSDVEQALAATRRALAAAPQLGPLARELRQTWDDKRLKTLREWSLGNFGKGERATLGPDAEGVSEPAAILREQLRRALELDPERLQAVRSALAPLLRRALAELRRRGAESYDALLRDAARLLSKAGPAARVRAGLDQLLVDEFQDTDRTQCDVLRALALSGDARPGLFLVGDPKQSIYGWRSADLAAYERFLRQVEEAGGERHELSLNFRSAPGILDEVERVMRPAMRYERDVQPEFARLVPTVESTAQVEYWASWGREGDGVPRPLLAAQAAAVEARAVAEDLRRLQDDGVPLGEVALLFRTRSDFDVYLAALRTAGVPYSVEGDRGFYRRREIIEASALVRAVVDPQDALSLLTWLRSASVGVPDAALLPLWRERLPELCAELPSEGIDEVVRGALEHTPRDVPGLERVRGWEHALRDALEALGELRQSFASDAPDVFVEKLRARTLLEATESARFLGAYRLANLDRFFRELVARLERGDRDPQAVLRELRSSVQIGKEQEEGRSLAPGPSAVNVLTIHRAKGLDFEHVYLLQTQKAPGGRAGGEPFGTRVEDGWEYRLDGAPTLGYRRALEQAQRVADAERVRTLYVALTRAKRRLVIAGAWSRKAAGSHQAILAGREGGIPELAPLVSKLASEGRAEADLHGVRWVVPALRKGSEGAVSRGRAATRYSARARADGARLRDASLESAGRMRRPLRGAASETAHARLAATATNGAGLTRDVAMRAGTEIHRLLEDFDLDAEPAAELARQRERALRRVEGEAADATAALIDALGRGSLLARLRELRPSIVARELPVLLPPGADEAGPVGCVEGVLDLVYVDPDSGRYVVADYKTDAEVEGRVEAYAGQLEVYARALREGLGLDEPPRRELWFLRADRIVTLEDDGVHSGSP